MVMSPQSPKDDYETLDFEQYHGDTEPADLTLRVAPPGARAAFERLLGAASFREDATLCLAFQDSPTPLLIQPPALLALGRGENNTFKMETLDLTPYQAREHGVSRFHALLHRSARTLAVEDMDSTNGTYINGVRLKPHEPQVLHDGDELRLGRLVIRVTFQ